ncbi:alpha/beta hydrolase [Zobellia galactanivorans]|uniref:Alpha/beta hydrolase-fold protein n=1 Tax=Zobellia galactanivorans (strain DSM 12802 / CCUG 47099 / CIP 106680 / NCIMB 13871 / Dsij) TaxID=63186 RepID=G0LCB6_ZOBGA|nr:alpha/beta hydrolase [Zobellia galactanivorans]MDO6810759.1 alpha/beta hydrolase [Zobellia galactanivorans]CAZ96806.1 Alpha/beta hydrolase-fold protein [Zobellia galactanivorans]
MKLILKIIKWIGKIFAGLIILILVSGLCFRLFSSKPVPPGKLVNVDGTKLHIRAEGPKNQLPTIILESGAGNDTDVFHWVAEGLKKSLRVVRYDREGKWFSEPSKDSITSEFYARQLHKLLEKNGEKPPYILAGHSMGGPYNRIFRDLYPNEIKAMVFIDSSHPEQWKRLAENGLFEENQISLIKTLAVLSDMGLMGVYNSLRSRKSIDEDLPKDCQNRKHNLTSYSGKVYRRYLKENRINNDILLRASQSSRLDSLPVLVFTAKEQYGDSQIWYEMQKELKELSTKGKQFYMDANHGSIITKKENAEIINKEILLIAETN